jgi:predicted HicB family RNase H-like nuclease
MPKAREYVDERVQLQFRLSTDLRDRLRAQAERRAVSVNYLIERAIEDAVVKWEKERKIAS